MSAPKIYIVYYSTYRHVSRLAKEIAKGVQEQGADVKLFQVQETLSQEILDLIHAPPQEEDVPVIQPQQLSEADGILFGFPTRFGMLPSQMKAFFDGTGGLWASKALAGKFAGIFFSTASQHGGQETTAMSTIPFFAHHGMNYVPLGFPHEHMFTNEEVVGGSAWGAGTVANGDGSRQPSEKELTLAYLQGQNFAQIVAAYVRGRDATDIAAAV
ncbi:hypothetical protein BZG36_02712 [Bifiguratus adelaidae]|uniref:Flavodoxin-like domain-containing protein n=1 Tax=Bifiguratus adelaidae TaxID=1938954 RepID=A0A261Y1S8_9FUNG|nr:hypothetical protein BZG36_02712 [Bifiguratus adelaidae]